MNNSFKSNNEKNSEMSIEKRFVNNNKQNTNMVYLGYKKKKINLKSGLDNMPLNSFFAYYNQPQNAPRKIMSLSEIEYLESNIALINSFFFSLYHNKSKINKFKEKYKNLFTNNYLDILFTIKEFPDFNIFDYLNISFDLIDQGENKKREKKLIIITRNNIILNLLVIATELHLHEEEGLIQFPRIEKKKTYPHIGTNNNSLLFDDLSFLNKTIEQFKNLIVEEDNVYNIEYDVEILFLSLLGYKNTARVIKQKHHEYFKTFMEECEFIDDFNLDLFLTNTIEKQYFESLTQSEILVFRKILNNAARRKFYYGFELLFQNIEFCYISAEGRIWKNIGKKMAENEVFNLWNIYEINIESIQSCNLVETLFYEANLKLKALNAEKKFYHFFLQTNQFNGIFKQKKKYAISKTLEYSETIAKINHSIRKITQDLKLNFVTSLRQLLEIFFKTDLKELVMFFIDSYKSNHKINALPIEIYELCINYDEDISIDIMDISLNVSNVKAKYMQICLIKKYFRLARHLLKFYICRDYLNSPPPKNDDYIGLISKIQYKSKRQLVENATFKHARTGKSLLNFLKESRPPKNSYSEDNTIDDEIYGSEVSRRYLNISNLRNSENSYISNYSSIYQTTTSNLIQKNLSSKYLQDNFNVKEESYKSFTNIIKKFNTNEFGKEKKQGLLSRVRNKFSRKKLRDSKGFSTKELPKINLITPLSTNKKSESINFSALGKIEKFNLIKKQKSVVLLNSKRSRKKFAINVETMDNSLNDNSINMSIIGNEDNESDYFSPKKYGNNNGQKFRKSAFCPHVSSKYSNDSASVDEKSKQTYKSSDNLLSSPSLKITTPRRKKSQRNKKIRSSVVDIKIENLEQIDFQINVQNVLIDQLRFGEYVSDALCLLNSIDENSLNRNNFHKIFSFLLIYTTNEDALTRCKEPLLFIGLAAELLLKLGKLNNKLMYKARAVADEILDLGEKIQSSIKDEDMLNFFLREQFDHKGRNALNIYAENKFFNLLSDNSIGGIVQKIWYGNGYEYNCLRYLRISRILFTNEYYETFEQVYSIDYFPKYATFKFQYHAFKYNSSSKYLMKTIFIFLICIYYEYIVYSLPSDHSENHEMFKYSENTGNILLLSIYLDYILKFIFFYKTGRKVTIKKLEILILTVCLFCSICFYIKLPERISSDISDRRNIFVDSILVSLILIMLWLKIMSFLSASYIYGPFIRILINIFWQVFAFMIIVVCIIFLFGQCFTLFFQHSNSDFDFFYDSFITLFGTAFGQVEFDKFTHLEVFGYIFLMAFTTLSNIMLFNLIVGIINNLFNNEVENADAESRAILILIHEKIKWDDKYSYLIFLPPPINFITIFFFLFEFLAEDKIDLKFCNDLFCKIGYVFLSFSYFIYILILSVLCFPFTLGKSYYHLLYDFIYKRNFGLKVIYLEKRRKARFIINLIFLPFMLLLSFIEDLLNFWKICYKEKLVEPDNQIETEFTKDYIIELRRVFSDLRFKEKKKIISLYEIYERLNLVKKKKLHDVSSDSDNKSSRSHSISNMNLTRTNSYNQDSFTIESELGRAKRIENGGIINLENKYLKESFKIKFRSLLDKLADIEGNIDLERALTILPYRVKYSENFLKFLKFLNIRVLIRGIRKLLFKNERVNPNYYFKKVQILIYKIMIKFFILYHYLNENELYKIQEEGFVINNNPQFQRNGNLMMIFEKRDDESEYDDEGDDFLAFSLLTKNISNSFTKFVQNLEKKTE